MDWPSRTIFDGKRQVYVFFAAAPGFVANAFDIVQPRFPLLTMRESYEHDSVEMKLDSQTAPTLLHCSLLLPGSVAGNVEHKVPVGSLVLRQENDV